MVNLQHPKMRFLATWNHLIVVVASAVPMMVGVTVETWLCGFFLATDYVKNKLLKVSDNDFRVKMSMSTTSI